MNLANKTFVLRGPYLLESGPSRHVHKWYKYSTLSDSFDDIDAVVNLFYKIVWHGSVNFGDCPLLTVVGQIT
jgi:hypothetical protein